VLFFVQRLPLSVQEVVEGAPSLTEDGGLVVGGRTTTVFLVDANTGALRRAFLEYGGGLAEINNAAGAHPDALLGSTKAPFPSCTESVDQCASMHPLPLPALTETGGMATLQQP
jgi:hypothetical protein